MSDLQLIVITNPFDRRERDEHRLPAAALPTVEALVGEYIPAGHDVQVSVNGHLVARDEWGDRSIQGGDQVVVMPVVGKSGGGILATVAMIVVAIYAPEIAGAMLGTEGGAYAATALGSTQAFMTVAQVGIVLAGSALIGAMTPVAKPKLPGLSSYDASPAYGWNPATTQEPGGPIVRAYGRVKLYGNVIAGYIENQGDTGREQVANLLIDLGQGPYSRLYDFEVNDQPLNNYRGVTLDERRGYLDQALIPAFDDTRLTRAIGSKVVSGSPVTRVTAGSDFNALEIVLTCPNGLYYANDSGGLSPVSVRLTVEISGDGGANWRPVATTPRNIEETISTGYWSQGYWTEGYWLEVGQGGANPTDHYEGEAYYVGESYYTWRWINQAVTVARTVEDSVTLTGAQQQPIRKTFRADGLTRGQAYQVRITNLSADATDSRTSDDVYLAEINEVLYDDFTYPRTVLVGVRALATDQLSGGLKFDCMAEAAIVRVYGPTISGFDGFGEPVFGPPAWTSAFSRNPAWIAWDILTQPVMDNSLNVVRYDGRNPSTMDLPAFYAWAAWCEELVPNGQGDYEPRCCFDGIFDTVSTNWESALEVAASARATLLMRGTTVTVVWDRVRTTPAQIFTVGNTAENSFREVFLPLADRAQAVEVEFVNADQGHERDKLTVVNTSATEAAAQRVQFSSRGIRRPSQAWREAMFALERNKLLKRTANLGADIDAIACTVGDLVWVQQDVTRWGEGGRIVSGTSTTLVLDKEVTLAVGKTYEVRLRLSDDTIVTRTITTPAGTVSSVTVSSAFPSTPSPYDVWAIGEAGRAVKEFVVTDLVRDGEQRANLSLIEYNPSLYNVDLGLPTLPTSDISARPAMPYASNLRVEESMYWAPDGSIAVHANLWFDIAEPGNFGEARVTMTRPDGSQSSQMVRGAPARFDGLVSGQSYSFTVACYDLLGRPQASETWGRITYAVQGEIPEPSDVTGFAVNIVGDTAYLSWDATPDFDASHYTIRYSPATSGASWNSSVELVPKIAKTATSITVPAAVGTWLIKAFDRGGRESKNATAVVSTVAALAGLNAVATVTESPTWAGTKSGTEVVGSALRLSSADTLSGWAALAAVPALSYGENGIRSAGTYTFAQSVDLGAVYTSRLSASITAVGENLRNVIAAWSSLSSVVTLSGTSGGDYTAQLEVRTTNDDPAGTPTWSAWKPFVVGDYTARAFQWRVTLESRDPAVTPSITALSVSVDMPDRVDGQRNISALAAGTTVSFAPAFKVTPAIGISAQNMATGDYYTITSPSATGFTIRFFNSAGTGVARTFDYVAKGYGRLQ